ncbi:class I SAM-dependent methyltransferase [Candidatus Parcubacteria bacterium]|nr:MAG: class I SAM-dependent methyltransferase [Candidatus Parcubacteria bacterium]
MRSQRTTPILHQIEEIAESVPGWTPVDQLYALFNLAFLTAGQGGDIVEIGSWCGRSTAVLGLAARLAGGRVFAIDLFPARDDWQQNPDGTYSFAVETDEGRIAAYQSQTVWPEPFLEDIAPLYEKHDSIRDIFDETIARYRLQKIVLAHRGDSAFCARLAAEGIQCRMAFIDGDHSYQAVCQDIQNVERILRPGGWICFDDAFSAYEGVNKAIEEHILGSASYDLCQQLTRKFFVARRKA